MATQGQVSMSYLDTPLWRALDAMRIEPEGAALTFTRKLARKQNWARRHAEAVTREYCCFLYLAATSERPVTPSDDVDEAWHLHLTYTRHYWDELCGRILGRPLHHDPTEGGIAQQAHFKDQYEATLARYEAVFGEPPRPDIWPAPALRFARPRSRLWARFGAAGAASLAVTACTALAGATGGGGVLTIVLAGGILVLLLGFIGIAAASQSASRSRKNENGCGGDGGAAYAGDLSSDCNGADSGSCGDGGSSGCGGGGCGGGCGGS